MLGRRAGLVEVMPACVPASTTGGRRSSARSGRRVSLCDRRPPAHRRRV